MTRAEELLTARIREAGRITFAEFMETALYDPEAGYYTRPGRISARGDFYTSPEVHPAFGALICVQLREMWTLLGRPQTFRCVEYGAAGGTLAQDVTGYAARIDPDFAGAIDYSTIDRTRTTSPRPVASRADDTAAQADAGHGKTAPQPAASLRDGCVLSNELLDAFPVHRFVIMGGRLQELYVHLYGARFVEQPGEPSTPELENRLSDVLPGLPEGYRGEVNLGIAEWAVQAGRELDRGFVLTIDFGYDRSELYSPERASGTLRCYRLHTATSKPFVHVGDQDIAAHVDFSEVDCALGRSGFRRFGHTSQREFLLRLGADDFLSRLPSAARPHEVARNRAAIVELLKPDGLGAFRVAVHGKGLGNDVVASQLTGLAGPNAGPRIKPDRLQTSEGTLLPVPVLGPGNERVPVLEGRYPHAAFELTGTWDELLT